MTLDRITRARPPRRHERSTSRGASHCGDDVAALVVAAAGGDQRAWSHLVARFNAPIRAIARRHGLSEADQDDVAQRTWLRLVRHIGSVRQPAAIVGWLATTARHECFRVRQASGRELPIEEAELAELVDPASVEDHLVENERRAALYAALERLPAHQAPLMRALLAEPPLSYDDISAALGVPRGSLGPTRRRSIARLRRDPHLARALQADRNPRRGHA